MQKKLIQDLEHIKRKKGSDLNYVIILINIKHVHAI